MKKFLLTVQAVLLGAIGWCQEAAAQTIHRLVPAGAGWNLEVTVPEGVKYTVEASLDLRTWLPRQAGLSGTGAVQSISLGQVSGASAFFRLKMAVNTAPGILAWDISATNAAVGVVLYEAQNRFTAAEVLEYDAGGAVVRKRAMHFLDRASGKSVLLRLGPDGLPYQLYLDPAVMIEFTNHQPDTRRVTWRVLDGQGTQISAPKVTEAPLSYFQIPAAAPRQVRNNTSPPGLGETLWHWLKATINFAGAVGTNADSKADIIINTAGVLTGPAGFAKDLGAKPGAVVDGAVWGVNAAQCGSFLAQAAAYSNPVGAPGWAVLSLQITSGSIACAETAAPVVGALTDKLIGDLEAQQKVNEYLRLGDLAFGQAGMPTQVTPTPFGIGDYSRRDAYFTMMNRALSLYLAALAVIEDEFSWLSQIERVASSSQWAAKMQAWRQQATTDRNNLETSRSSLEGSFSLVTPAALAAARELCAKGEASGCLAAQLYEELVQYTPRNLIVLQSAVDSIDHLISSLTGP